MWRFIFSPPASVSGSALAASVCKKITGRLTSAIAKQEDVSVQLEALDIMADMLCRYVVRRSPMDGAGGDGWSFEFFSVSPCLQTGGSAGEFPPLHPQLPSASAHLPPAGRQKGLSNRFDFCVFELSGSCLCPYLLFFGRFRGPSWLWATWLCPAEIWYSSTWSSTSSPSWGGMTTCRPPGHTSSARPPSADRLDTGSVRRPASTQSCLWFRDESSLTSDLWSLFNRWVPGEDHPSSGEVL